MTVDLMRADDRARPLQRRWRRAGLASLAALVVILAAFLPRAGGFIVAEDQFPHADVAVVLSGGPVPRTLAARDLYREGRIDRIVIIPEAADPVNEELIELGLHDPTVAPISARILAASGVPGTNVSFLPAPADGTIEEARRVRAFFGDRLPARIAVVTSKFASRRACFIFRRVLTTVAIACVPSSYDSFDPSRWWTQPRNALLVAMEYQKFIANAVMLMWQPA